MICYFLLQNSKPKLPRKVASSARVNLNKCWTKLGELVSNSSAKPDLPTQKTAYEDEPILLPFSDYFYPIDPVKPDHDTEDDDNAKNQNIINSQRFELVADETREINENMANEVREICYSALKVNCYLCTICN